MYLIPAVCLFVPMAHRKVSDLQSIALPEMGSFSYCDKNTF